MPLLIPCKQNHDRGLKQVSNISLTQNLGTLYNQDFFVVDTTGRGLSQIPQKLNYPYPLPNGHSALQLRLPDLLIYLKTDTYLIDVNTGDHYAIYSDRIQKMSVSPKLYSAWGYRQLLQTIQNDATRFGVNSPQPSTSGVSQSIQTTSRQAQPSPVAQYMQPPASPYRHHNTNQTPKTDAGLAPALSTSGNTPSEDTPAKGTTHKPETGHPLIASLKAGETPSEDTLSSTSSEELLNMPFK